MQQILQEHLLNTLLLFFIEEIKIILRMNIEFF